MLAIKTIFFLSVYLVILIWGQIVSDVVHAEFLWEGVDRTTAMTKSERGTVDFLLQPIQDQFPFPTVSHK